MAVDGSGNAVAISPKLTISPGHLCYLSSGGRDVAGENSTELGRPRSGDSGRNFRKFRDYGVNSVGGDIELDHDIFSGSAIVNAGARERQLRWSGHRSVCRPRL